MTDDGGSKISPNYKAIGTTSHAPSVRQTSFSTYLPNNLVVGSSRLSAPVKSRVLHHQRGKTAENPSVMRAPTSTSTNLLWTPAGSVVLQSALELRISGGSRVVDGVSVYVTSSSSSSDDGNDAVEEIIARYWLSSGARILVCVCVFVIKRNEQQWRTIRGSLVRKSRCTTIGRRRRPPGSSRSWRRSPMPQRGYVIK